MSDLAHCNEANNAYIYKNIPPVLSAGKSVTGGKRTANAENVQQVPRAGKRAQATLGLVIDSILIGLKSSMFAVIG